MTRQLVSRDHLHWILNEQLHERDPCGQCRFTHSPNPLREPDESGCNWSQDLILRYGRNGGDSCARAASQTITEVAAHFNLAPDAVD
jgi:hypothetical protein